MTQALTNDKSWTIETVADGWLIAIAKNEGFVIVTEEINNINLNKNQPSKSVKIPDIAKDFGIRCIDRNTFFLEVGLIV